MTEYVGVGHSAWEEVYDNSGQNKSQTTGSTPAPDAAPYYEWTSQEPTWYEWLLSNPKAGSESSPTNITLSTSNIINGLNAGEFTTTLEADGLPSLFTFSLVSGSGDTDNGEFSISDNVLTLNTAVDIATKSAYNIRIEATNSEGSFQKAFILEVIDPDKTQLTVTPDDKEITYGEALPNFTLSYDGFIDGDDESSLTTLPTSETNASNMSEVGTYDITASGGESIKYFFFYNTGTLTVSKALLTARFPDSEIAYGENIPALEIVYEGFVHNDDESVLDDEPTISSEITSSSEVGDYTVTIEGGSDDNYDFSLIDGQISINKATLTASFENTEITYGDNVPELVIDFNGFVNNEDTSVLDIKPSISSSISATSNAGDYPVEITGGEDNNYDFELINGTITVIKATLTAQIENKEITYGADISDLVIHYEGFVNGEDITVIDSQPTFSSEYSSGNDVGEYTVDLTGGEDNNYNFELIDGVITVGRAPLTARFNNVKIRYGDDIPELKIIYQGFVAGDDESVLDTQPSISSTVSSESEVGEYTVDVTGGEDNNYDINTTDGKITIGKATLTAKFETIEITYGENIPELEITYEGLVNGEKPADLDNQPALSTTVTSDSDAGEYEVKLSGGSDKNYVFALINGKVIINKADQNISLETISKQTSDTEFVVIDAESSSGLPLEYALISGPAEIKNDTIFLEGVEGEIIFEVSQSGSTNYNPAATVQGTFLVESTSDDTDNDEVLATETSESYKIYPNPTENDITVNLEDAKQRRIQVISFTGKILIDQNVRDSRFTLDISNLSRGTYLLMIDGLETYRFVVK